MPTAASHVWRPSCARRIVLDGFVPVPRGVLPALPAAFVWPAKDPADVLDYELDIGSVFVGNDGDGIATLDVAITPNATGDLTLTGSAADGVRAVMWFAGGQVGTTYAVQISIGTTNGRTISRVILLPVQALSVAVVPTSTLQTSGGAVITDQNGNPILIGS